MQPRAEVQDTEVNKVCFAALGSFCIVHFAPFHRSASATGVPEGVLYAPTAVQPLGTVQETPVSDTPELRAGSGTFRTVHFDPFQVSASAAGLPLPLLVVPTATHERAEGHEIALNALKACPDGLGVASMRQRDPFQVSASVSVTVGFLS